MSPQDRHPAHRDEDSADLPQQLLSALLDGDLQGSDAHAALRACALWRDDARARQSWHAWNLIGDVMRSEELARAPARDVAFLARLRERLADEPVVLAPAPAVAAAAAVAVRGWRAAWLLPTAVAAGFVMVAGVLVVARTVPPQATPVLAASPAAGLSLASVPGEAPYSASASASGAFGLIRDARLDNYLRAHQAARGSPAAAVPGGGMRNVEVILIPSVDR